MTHPVRAGEHAAQVHRKTHHSLEQAVTAYERTLAAALTAYRAEVARGSEVLDRALNTATAVRESIMDPAQAAYDRQTKLAEHASAQIIKPAQDLFDRIQTEADAAWQSVYTAATKALSGELAAINAVASANQPQTAMAGVA